MLWRMDTAFTWGTTLAERHMRFPCDQVLPAYDQDMWRGVTVAAPAATVFRWLCQLRVAPYSYDWIDNGARRSPQQLVPGLDQLAAHQIVMTIFHIVSFATNEHLTVQIKPTPLARRVFGDGAISYVLVPCTLTTTRLLAKLRVRYSRTPLRAALRALLPWGDLLMMRKQLINLKRLAERDGAGVRTMP